MVLSLVKVLGVVIFLYLGWRNLKDDYQPEESLVSYSWASLLGFGIGGRIAYGLINWGVWNENWWEWFSFWNNNGFNYIGAYGGWLLLTIWFAYLKKWKTMYLLEDTSGLVMILLAFLLTDKMWSQGVSWVTIAPVVIVLLGYLISNGVKGKYRSLWWYKSGKKGFGFWFTNVWVGLLLGVYGAVFGQGWPVVVIFVFCCLISGVGLVILGDDRRKK